MHYRPRTLILNNLEFDHADIFDDIRAIQTQFHNLLRTVPASGLVIAPSQDDELDEVLHRGVWTPVSRVGQRAARKPVETDSGELWSAREASDGSFEVHLNEEPVGSINWPLLGDHNRSNALGAIAAARHAGVPVATAVAALSEFKGVKRRLEVLFEAEHFVLYDDFAHHPTAIRSTLQGLRRKVGNEEIIAVVEPRTHTMSLGTLRQDLSTCCAAADSVIWFRGENIKWDLMEVVQDCVVPAKMFDNHESLVDALVLEAANSERRKHVVIMSNGAFGGIYTNLTQKLNQ